MSALRIVDLVEVDGEPRILDERLAYLLGYSETRSIRVLIKRNADELLRYGDLNYGNSNRPAGRPGRAPDEVYLNEGQALLICVKAKTARAADAREEIINVFLAWRHGRLAPVTPVTTEVLDNRLVPIHDKLTEIGRAQEETDGRVKKIEGNVVFLGRRLDDIVPRRDFPKWCREQFIEVCRVRYNGECPTCPSHKRTKLVCDGGSVTGDSTVDHARGREMNGVDDGWVVCRKCNKRLHDDREFRAACADRFNVFQSDRRALFGKPPPKTPDGNQSSFHF